MIGHCAGAMLFDMAGVIDGKTIAVHPLAKSAIQKGKATDNKPEADGNIYTAQDENNLLIFSCKHKRRKKFPVSPLN